MTIPYVILFVLIYLFIYFWLSWVFVAARGLSLAVASGGLLFVAVPGLLSHRRGFSCCEAPAPGTQAPGTQAQ